MSLLTETKYCNIFGTTYLDRFKIKNYSPYLANFRCPVCGDSKNKNKARGYFYQIDQKINAKCHNCGWSTTFSKALEQFAPAIHEEYKLELFKENGRSNTIYDTPTPSKEKVATKKHRIPDVFKNVKKISQLSPNHKAKKYVTERRIPSRQHYRIYYVPCFFEWSNSVFPGKFNENALKMDEPRLVLPFVDENGYCFGWTGRSINTTTSLRYATVILDDNKTKVFGLDQIDRTKDILVLEGPIDSLFFSNSVAMAGADVDLDAIASKDKMIIAMDNQPRNKEVVDKVEKLVYNDYRVCIWPDWFKYKDINDAILGGYTPRDLRKLITDHTYQGLTAQISFTNWKKL
jgi:hypothetical protein